MSCRVCLFLAVLQLSKLGARGALALRSILCSAGAFLALVVTPEGPPEVNL